MFENKLYLEVYEQLMTDILNCKYLCGEKLPSLSRLCEEYNVGRNTIRSAMILLENRGFIQNQRGARAIVVFNINEMESQFMYKKSIYERKQAYEDIFQFLSWCMPELIIELKKRTNNEKLTQLVEKINTVYMNKNKIYSQKEFVDKFYGIILELIALFKNTLLDTLFRDIFHFIYLPLPQDKQNPKFDQITQVISDALPKMAIFLLTKNDFVLRQSISFLLSTLSHATLNYVFKIGKDIGQVEFTEFNWKSTRHLDLRYMDTVIEIILDINKKKYLTFLPSLQQLSENYQTSLRTIRKACDLLNQYHIIQKSNGLKSRIIIDEIHDPKILLSNKEIISNILLYKEALQIVFILAKGLNKPVLSACDEEALTSFIQRQELSSNKTVLTHYIEFIFLNSNSALINIYRELNKSLVWNIYNDTLFDPKLISYDFIKRNHQFVEALSKRKYNEINRYIDEILYIIENVIDQLLLNPSYE